MSLEVPFEQRLIDLQAQIDQLSLTLQLWRDTQDHLQPMERRLAQLTEQCADILDNWKETGERHARAVNQLETRLLGWNEVEARLQHEASQRFGELERAIEHEWAALRQLHEEPVKELREQATTLTEICAAAAGSAQTGLERAEARLSTLEGELHRRMDDMTFEIRGLVSDLRLQAGGGEALALRPAAAPWPLEGVARLHQQLRDDKDGTPTADPPESSGDGSMALALRNDGAPRATAQTVPPSLAAAEVRTDEPRTQEPSAADARRNRTLIALAGVVLAATVALSLYLYQQVGAAAARAAEAQQETVKIVAASEERLRATREEAAGQIAEARTAAARAQMVSDVLAAPDLTRFNLIGGEAAQGLTAQVLFSRSRGTILSGSQPLPPVPNGSVYQMWLITPTEMLSAGTFEPDASGRATFAAGSLPYTSQPIVSARVTLEPAPGRQVPGGPIVLRRAPAPAPPQP